MDFFWQLQNSVTESAFMEIVDKSDLEGGHFSLSADLLELFKSDKNLMVSFYSLRLYEGKPQYHDKKGGWRH